MPGEATMTLSRRIALRRLGGGAVAAALAVPSPAAGTAQDATPAAPPPFLVAWLAAWARNASRVDALYAEDAVVEDVPAGVVLHGRDEIRAHVQAEFAGFPDHGCAVRSAFVAGDLAAAEVVFTGTYTGRYPGLPPGTGQTVTLPGAAIFALAGGKIRREAHYYDGYSLRVQLGLLPAPETAATPAGGAAAAVSLDTKDFAFQPAQIEIPAGITVTWVNRDGVAHTVTAFDRTFDSGNLDPGQSFSHTFDRPGRYDYVCLYHPSMTGTVAVQ